MASVVDGPGSYVASTWAGKFSVQGSVGYRNCDEAPTSSLLQLCRSDSVTKRRLRPDNFVLNLV